MEEYMRESMRKLALWYTKTFKPMITHDELEPIMSTMGFVGLPPSANGWKEYVFSSSGSARSCRSRSLSAAVEPAGPPPRPRLPYPHIDGLHIYTYRAFLDAVGFYLDIGDISDLFHVRGMPLHRVSDKHRKWRRMEEEETVFVYREGTLDQPTFTLYHSNKLTNHNNNINGSNHIPHYNALFIRNKEKSNVSSNSILVSLKDIIV